MIGQSRGLWSGGVESELGSHGTMEMGDTILGHFDMYVAFKSTRGRASHAHQAYTCM
jgi:hypothetical protein